MDKYCARGPKGDGADQSPVARLAYVKCSLVIAAFS
jgi:hypothetical protein